LARHGAALDVERAHYEIAAGRLDEARRLLDTLEHPTSDGFLIPEQVWDADPIPEREEGLPLDTLVLIRQARQVSMLPAVALSCFLTSAVAWPFAQTGPWAELPMLDLMLFGVAQLGLGLLLSLGMRRVPAVRAALIGLLDTPLAPVWVWLAFNETPPRLTLVGGVVVMAAVLWNMLAAPSR